MSRTVRLAAVETLVTAWSGVPDALTVEILARGAFDAVTLGMQLRSLVPTPFWHGRM